MDRSLTNVLVTGGCGFIGSNFIRYLLAQSDFTGRIINADALTYAGNPLNLSDLQDSDRYRFVHVDIRDEETVQRLFEEYDVDTVVHFAAESHVDRSIFGPRDFITTNIMGTFNLLERARAAWKDRSDVLFHHVSTDEVYGSLGDSGAFVETTPYDPKSPYSASKASSDHIVRAYAHTFNVPATISNCSNNYGPYQFPEKLIPVMILNMLEKKPLPVYGQGLNVRDWLYVTDHAEAIWAIMKRGPSGETYNVGGENEWKNIDLVRHLCEVVADQTDADPQEYLGLIKFVTDRPGHDHRYAIDCTKIKSELGWTQAHDFAGGLRETVAWYLANTEWIDSVRSGDYREWIDRNYGQMNRA
ncbi:MAG: dTDP-glucose 4,6-dehydratase [Spirochaetota bacterium]